MPSFFDDVVGDRGRLGLAQGSTELAAASGELPKPPETQELELAEAQGLATPTETIFPWTLLQHGDRDLRHGELAEAQGPATPTETQELELGEAQGLATPRRRGSPFGDDVVVDRDETDLAVGTDACREREQHHPCSHDGGVPQTPRPRLWVAVRGRGEGPASPAARPPPPPPPRPPLDAHAHSGQGKGKGGKGKESSVDLELQFDPGCPDCVALHTRVVSLQQENADLQERFNRRQQDYFHRTAEIAYALSNAQHQLSLDAHRMGEHAMRSVGKLLPDHFANSDLPEGFRS